jgi:hypothetical protein
MTYTVRWSPEADADSKQDYDVATAVCKAVIVFAEDGLGDVEPEPDAPTFFRITAPGGFASLSVDEDEQTLYVWRIVSNSPPARVVPMLDEPEPEPPESE